MAKPWSRAEILADLRKLKRRRARPDPFSLKAKYGYEENSRFFPILEDIRTTERNMRKFIDDIFGRVTNKRDLNFRYGECHCDMCHDRHTDLIN